MLLKIDLFHKSGTGHAFVSPVDLYETSIISDFNAERQQMSSKSQKRQNQNCASGQTDDLAANSCSAIPTSSREEQEELIRERAYELWEAAGRPEGDIAREKFWADAELELLSAAARES